MSRDPALPRFMALQLARLCGALIALAGVVILSHGIRAFAFVPDAVGDGMIVAGAVVFFALPRHLARKWKSRQ